VAADVRPVLVRLMGEDVGVRFAPGAGMATIYGDPHQLEHATGTCLTLAQSVSMAHAGLM
jgi:hypothetical protein